MQKVFSFGDLSLWVFVILLPYSFAMGFSANDPIVVRSDNSRGCTQGHYERTRDRVLDFNGYHSIDDQISWPIAWRFMMGSNRKPLDMTLSQEIYPESLDTQNDEIKRSQVAMAFSPAGLGKDYSAFYPRMHLSCRVLERPQESSSKNRSLNHECELTTGPSYAITAFTSDLHLVENACGQDTLGAFFEVSLRSHPDEVAEIYQAIIDEYELRKDDLDTLLSVFSSVLPSSQQGERNSSNWLDSFVRPFMDSSDEQQASFLQQTLLPFYFEKLYNELIL